MLRTCELALSGEVKTQNAPFLLHLCIANRSHGATAWTFVRQHWDEANATFPTNTIVRMVDSVRLLTDETVAADVQAFFAEHPIEQAAKTLEQVLERQRVNTALRARETERFAAASDLTHGSDRVRALGARSLGDRGSDRSDRERRRPGSETRAVVTWS